MSYASEQHFYGKLEKELRAAQLDEFRKRRVFWIVEYEPGMWFCRPQTKDCSDKSRALRFESREAALNAIDSARKFLASSSCAEVHRIGGDDADH